MKLHALALALGLASASAFAGNIITIDPDGLGSAAAIQVSSLGWNNGNALTVTDGVGGVDLAGLVQTYAQGGLSNFNGTNGNAIGNIGLNSAYQWTYVFGVQEAATPIGGVGASFATTSGGENFFKIYYNAGVTQNNLNGTGFTDGQLILSGTIKAYDASTGQGTGSFFVTSPNLTNLDHANGADNYSDGMGNTLLSTVGVGTTNLEGLVSVAYADPNFFKGVISDITIVLDTFNSQPFIHVDPSSCFTDASGNLIGGAGQNNTLTAPGQCANSIGYINGVTGPNIMFETRATNDFVATTVPEPASMALVGLGLLSMLGLKRKRG